MASLSASINKAILLMDRPVPTETPVANEAYFFLDGGSLKYKTSTGTFTLATGVTAEEVQDLIASALTSGNTKLSITYNDLADQFIFTVVESNIVHQNLSGAGTNTHSQIDTHLASTSNPHATTKAQVGLGNVPNVDATVAANINQDSTHRFVTDAEKTTWNSKENAITAGTAAQFWRGDKTWQDLAGAVLSTALTGLSTATNAAVIATDSILVGIGKLQAQITSAIASIATKANLNGGNTFTGIQQILETTNSATSAVKSSAANQVSMFDSKNDLNEYTEIGTFGSTNPNTLFGEAMASASFLFSSAKKLVVGVFGNYPIIFGTNSVARLKIEAAGALNTLGNDIVNVLTGLSPSNVAVDASDSIRTAIGKLQGQLDAGSVLFASSQATQDARLDALEISDAQWKELITTGNLASNSAVTLSNISGLSINTVAGKKYYLEYTILFQSAATTTGLALSMGLTGGGTISAIANIPVSADGTAALFTGHITASGDTVVGTGVQAANTNYIATIRGIFDCTTSGTLFPQFRSEVSLSQVQVMAGSVALIREF